MRPYPVGEAPLKLPSPMLVTVRAQSPAPMAVGLSGS